MIKISIAKDFSIYPGGRHREDGEFSADEFLDKYIEPHFEDINNNELIEIDFDGTRGYGSSFIHQIFSVLSIKYGKDKILKRVKFKSHDKSLIEEAIEYINNPHIVNLPYMGIIEMD